MSATGTRLLLVGWDGSERARDALALAGVLARDCGYSVVVAQTYPGYETYGLKSEVIEGMRTRAEASLAELPRDLLRDVDFETREVQGHSPAEGLHREADHLGADLIVVGSTHRGAVGRVVPGSVAQNLLHGAPCAVAVAPGGYADSAPEHIAVIAAAYDGSPEARHAVAEAVELARGADACVRIVEVLGAAYGWGLSWTPAAYVGLSDVIHEDARKDLAELAESLPGEIRAETRLLDGDPVRKLLAETESGVGLLVMGSRGYGAVLRTLLGSVSSRVIHSASCPVVVTPAPHGAGGNPDGRHDAVAMAG